MITESLQYHIDKRIPVNENVYAVPRDTWHRVIKGQGSLVIQINEDIL